MHVAFVCTGNLCRSPMAEALLRARADEQGAALRISSSGTWAVDGEPAVSRRGGLETALGEDAVKRLAAEAGIDGPRTSARVFTAARPRSEPHPRRVRAEQRPDRM